MNADHIPPPEVLEALRALGEPSSPAPPQQAAKPQPDIFATPEQRIEVHLDRIATALEKIAAIEDAMSGASRCC